jgi:hypothetical protein
VAVCGVWIKVQGHHFLLVLNDRFEALTMRMPDRPEIFTITVDGEEWRRTAVSITLAERIVFTFWMKEGYFMHEVN